jgi:hypothetical protein
MPRRPRTACPVCGKSTALRSDGTLHGHRPRPGTREVCEGSGRKPEGSDA